jgi:hypothetical protein
MQHLRVRGLSVKRVTKISIAIACAFGMSAALAQSVQRGGVTVSNSGEATQTVAQASTSAPIQTAQAGGSATGASAGGAAAGAGLGTTLVVVGAAVAAIAIASDSDSPVSH